MKVTSKKRQTNRNRSKRFLKRKNALKKGGSRKYKKTLSKKNKKSKRKTQKGGQSNNLINTNITDKSLEQLQNDVKNLESGKKDWKCKLSFGRVGNIKYGEQSRKCSKVNKRIKKLKEEIKNKEGTNKPESVPASPPPPTNNGSSNNAVVKLETPVSPPPPANSSSNNGAVETPANNGSSNDTTK